MSAKAQQIMEELAGLSTTDLRSIRVVLNSLLVGTAEAVEQEAPGTVFYAITAALKDRGITPMPLVGFRRTKGWHEYEKKAALLERYVTDFFQPPDQTHRIKAYQILVETLVRWLDVAKVPVNTGTTCLHLDKIPGLIEREFPGYRESGLLPVVLTLVGGAVPKRVTRNILKRPRAVETTA